MNFKVVKLRKTNELVLKLVNVKWIFLLYFNSSKLYICMVSTYANVLPLKWFIGNFL